MQALQHPFKYFSKGFPPPQAGWLGRCEWKKKMDVMLHDVSSRK